MLYSIIPFCLRVSIYNCNQKVVLLPNVQKVVSFSFLTSDSKEMSSIIVTKNNKEKKNENFVCCKFAMGKIIQMFAHPDFLMITRYEHKFDCAITRTA